MAKFVAWNVYRANSDFVDTVFMCPSLTPEEVVKSLVDHDGFPPDIIVISG